MSLYNQEVDDTGCERFVSSVSPTMLSVSPCWHDIFDMINFYNL